MGAVSVGLYFHSGLTLASLAAFVFTNVMVLTAIVDWDYLIIPDSILLVGLLAGSLSFALMEGEEILSRYVDSLGAFSVVLAVMTLGTRLFGKPAMGFGDVKLAGVIGFFIGFVDFLVALWVACILGSAYWLFCQVSGKELRRMSIAPGRIPPVPDLTGSIASPEGTALPFGSFLSIAAIAVMFAHESIHTWIESWIALTQ